MGVAGKLRELRGRVRGDYTRPLSADFSAPLAGRRGLEIGGPSALFGQRGLLPLYPALASVDCVQWAATTAWHSLDPEAGFRPEGMRTGELYILDDIDLAPIASDRYDVVLSSHVIEHIANPLRALAAWRRVSVADGHLLMVAPHMAGTFDHRRPRTSLEHLVADFEQNTGEDDLTHLDEVLRRHDPARDAPLDPLRREAELRANADTRVLHHHTFTTLSLGELLRHAGLDIVAAQARLPHDIYLLGRWRDHAHGERAGSTEPDALIAAARASPFRVDRREARAAESRRRGSRSAAAQASASMRLAYRPGASP